MRFEDAGSEKERFLQLASEQLLSRPIRGFAIGMVISGYVAAARALVGGPRPTTQWKLGGELEPPPGRIVRAFAWACDYDSSGFRLGNPKCESGKP
jgi:hypothetical protein